jgi:hypothetical protein
VRRSNHGEVVVVMRRWWCSWGGVGGEEKVRLGRRRCG